MRLGTPALRSTYESLKSLRNECGAARIECVGLRGRDGPGERTSTDGLFAGLAFLVGVIVWVTVSSILMLRDRQ